MANFAWREVPKKGEWFKGPFWEALDFLTVLWSGLELLFWVVVGLL
jgi:hypothetical protein